MDLLDVVGGVTSEICVISEQAYMRPEQGWGSGVGDPGKRCLMNAYLRQDGCGIYG